MMTIRLILRRSPGSAQPVKGQRICLYILIYLNIFYFTKKRIGIACLYRRNHLAFVYPAACIQNRCRYIFAFFIRIHGPAHILMRTPEIVVTGGDGKMNINEMKEIKDDETLVNTLYDFFDEKSRLNCSKAARVEFMTTVRYIERYWQTRYPLFSILFLLP